MATSTNVTDDTRKDIEECVNMSESTSPSPADSSPVDASPKCKSLNVIDSTMDSSSVNNMVHSRDKDCKTTDINNDSAKNGAEVDSMTVFIKTEPQDYDDQGDDDTEIPEASMSYHGKEAAYHDRYKLSSHFRDYEADQDGADSSLFTASFVNMNSCQFCGRVFSRAEHLQRHVWIVHGVDRHGRIYDPVVEELERKQAMFEKRLAEQKIVNSRTLDSRSHSSVFKTEGITLSTAVSSVIHNKGSELYAVAKSGNTHEYKQTMFEKNLAEEKAARIYNPRSPTDRLAEQRILSLSAINQTILHSKFSADHQFSESKSTSFQHAPAVLDDHSRNSEAVPDHVTEDRKSPPQPAPSGDSFEKLNEISLNQINRVSYPFRLATQCHICGRIYSKGAHLRNHLQVSHGLSGDDALPDPIQEELLRKQALFECHRKSPTTFGKTASLSGPRVQQSSSMSIPVTKKSPVSTKFSLANILSKRRNHSPSSDLSDREGDDNQNMNKNGHFAMSRDSFTRKSVDNSVKTTSPNDSSQIFLDDTVCKFCGRHFVRVSLLEKHMWRVHGVDRFGNVDDPIIAELARKQALFEESLDEYDHNGSSDYIEKENKKPGFDNSSSGEEQALVGSLLQRNQITIKTEPVSVSPSTSPKVREYDERTSLAVFYQGNDSNSVGSTQQQINLKQGELCEDSNSQPMIDHDQAEKTFSLSQSSHNRFDNEITPNMHQESPGSIDIDRAQNKAVFELVNFGLQNHSSDPVLTIGDKSLQMGEDGSPDENINSSEEDIQRPSLEQNIQLECDVTEKLDSDQGSNGSLNNDQGDEVRFDINNLNNKQNQRYLFPQFSKSAGCCCPFCDKVCSRPVQLQRHIFRIHGVDRYGNIDDPIAAELARKQALFERKNGPVIGVENIEEKNACEDAEDALTLTGSFSASERVSPPPALKHLITSSNIDYSLATFGDVEVLTMKSEVVCSDSLGWKATGSLVSEMQPSDRIEPQPHDPCNDNLVDIQQRNHGNETEKTEAPVQHTEEENKKCNVEGPALPKNTVVESNDPVRETDSGVNKTLPKKRSFCLDQIAERLQKRAKFLSSQAGEHLDNNHTNESNAFAAEPASDAEHVGETVVKDPANVDRVNDHDKESSTNSKTKANQDENKPEGDVSNSIIVKSEPISPPPVDDESLPTFDISYENHSANEQLYTDIDINKNSESIGSGYDGSFRCHICGKCVARKPNLQKHLQRIHGLDKHGREIDPIAEELARKQALFEHKPLYETVSSILDHEELLRRDQGAMVGYVQTRDRQKQSLHSSMSEISEHRNSRSVCIPTENSDFIKVEPESPISENDDGYCASERTSPYPCEGRQENSFVWNENINGERITVVQRDET